MLTQQETQNTIAFFKANNLAWLGDDGDKNGTYFGEFIVQWSDFAKKAIELTPENLAVAYKKLQEAGRPFIYYSPAETQYHILEETHGKTWVDSIWGYFPGHRLEPTYDNFITVANYVIAKRTGTESRDAFTRAIGNIMASKQHQYGSALTFKPNPDEARRLKEIEQQKAATTIRRVTQEERDRAVSHISSNDLNDPNSTVRKIDPDSPLGRHRAMVEASMRKTERQVAQEQDPTEVYFGGRVTEYLNSIQSVNDRATVQDHVQKLRAQGLAWNRILVNVDNFYNQLKTNRWQSQQRG